MTLPSLVQTLQADAIRGGFPNSRFAVVVVLRMIQGTGTDTGQLRKTKGIRRCWHSFGHGPWVLVRPGYITQARASRPLTDDLCYVMPSRTTRNRIN